ncbi:proline iminopeptidase-family hydrolase [Brumicola nitratireducens]|uniref:Proline iminopeptidase n=1 Tax=Glaciecola nitratireducens (strain JCM 12485 / KCTC 12276 / FR1064) TaxID=1085623 RepID=G4QEY9_GLANF|nr:proline iminopeptidase-family hydrolase [Glaciecola nitratireducens]AEP28252.1 proline iminopeptidase [Glaciecola nitratireducens FR1064]
MHKVITAAMTALLWLALQSSVFAHQDPEQAGYIAVDGGRIWYRINGMQHLGKSPAIIMMHGGPGGTHRSNMPYVALSDTYPVILYDQLGSGNSERPGDQRNWNVKRFVDEIDHIRQALGLDEIIIAGHSWGGSLSAEYASRNPSGLKAAILSSPLISTPQWNKDNQDWVDELPLEAKTVLKKNDFAGSLDDPEFKAAVDLFYSRHMCRTDPCSTTSYRDDGPTGNDEMYVTMWGVTDFNGYGTLKDYDITDKLKDISVPSLVICGEFDEARPRTCHRYANMIENATTVIVPDAGHATMSADEAMYIKTVRDFLYKALK